MTIAQDAGLEHDEEQRAPADEWRRHRALLTAAALAEQGGWDAVVMRTVADRSGSALATLYKEFTSKANLLIAVAEVLVRGVDPPTEEEVHALGRLSAATGIIASLTDAASAKPRLTEAVLMAVLTCDPMVGREVGRLREQLMGMLLPCLGEPKADDAVRLDLLVDIWFSQVFAVAQGRQDVNGAQELLALAVARLLGT